MKIMFAFYSSIGLYSALMAAKKKSDKLDVMVGTRVPQWVKDFYDRWAKDEERKPGFVLRKVLVDYATANTNGKEANAKT